MRTVLSLLAMVFALPALALDLNTTFTNIDGGTHRLSDWKGQPVLVVNTASQCGFTGQYSALQKLHDTYGPRGLVVLAVPSDDFNQELASNEEVKEFCELNYDLTLPMTGITKVRGPDAHPFYRSVATEVGFEPKWNFNKILLSPEGKVAGTYGSRVKPMSRTITGEIEQMLNATGG